MSVNIDTFKVDVATEYAPSILTKKPDSYSLVPAVNGSAGVSGSSFSPSTLLERTRFIGRVLKRREEEIAGTLASRLEVGHLLNRVRLKKGAGIIYYIDAEHSEIVVCSRIFNVSFGKPWKESNRTMAIAKAKAEESGAPFKVHYFAISLQKLAEMNTDLERGRRVGRFNTCSGGAAEFISSYIDYSVPPVIRQSPSALAKFFDLVPGQGVEGVSAVELHGATEEAADKSIYQNIASETLFTVFVILFMVDLLRRGLSETMATFV